MAGLETPIIEEIVDGDIPSSKRFKQCSFFSKVTPTLFPFFEAMIESIKLKANFLKKMLPKTTQGNLRNFFRQKIVMQHISGLFWRKSIFDFKNFEIYIYI